MTKKKILIVDDEKAIRRTLKEILEYEKYDIDEAEDGEIGLEKIEKKNYDVVVLDIEMPGIDGIETLKRIKEINSKIQVVLFTGHGSEETRRMGEVLGAFSYVDKIDGLPKLAPMIEGAFRLRKVLEDTYADAAMNEYN